MRDGYSFGAEGDWKTSASRPCHEGNEQGKSGLVHEKTPIIFMPRVAGPSAHMLEICKSIAATKPRLDILPITA